MAGNEAVQHSVRRQAAHVDQPIDSFAVTVELKITLSIHGQGCNAQINTPRQPPVEADLFQAIMPPRFRRAEIQVFRTHGLLKLPGVLRR